MPSIIPRAYFCPNCKKEIKKKICNCGTKAKPVPPYTVRFRWINAEGLPEHKRIKGEPNPWETQAAAQRGYERWMAQNVPNKKIESRTVDFIPLYEEYRLYLADNVKESSYMAITQRIEKYVFPFFKDYKVTEIKPADIVKFQTSLNNYNLSAKYKNAIRSSLNHFFNYLKIYGIDNPVPSVKGFKNNLEAKREMLFWTEEEFKQFIAVVDNDRFRAVFLFLYLTGCRKGEALALKWEDINFKTNTANIKASISKATDRMRLKNEGVRLDSQYRLTTPKTQNSYRTVLLPNAVIDSLKALKGNCCKSDFIFGENGKIMPFNTLQHAFERYIERAGVKKIRIHDLRHSHASLLINKGENQLATLYIIAARLGDTVDMIFKTYGHLFPSNQTEIINKIDISF